MIAGAALGANFGAMTWSFYLLPLTAIALHHALDRVPHYDYKIKPFSLITASKVFVDLTFGILTIWVIYQFFNPAINIYLTALGAFFGVFPDGLLLISFFLPGKLADRYQNFHKFLHHRHQIVNGEEKKAISWTGLLTQIIAIIIAIYLLI